MQKFLTHLRDLHARIPLSPAETSVAAFVLVALVASAGLRAWNAIGGAGERPVPAEFAKLDSEFVARTAAPVASGGEGTLWAALLTTRKTPPALSSIELNSATPDQLRRLPSVGPALAARILAFRRATPFRRPQDLLRVEGIGPRKYERMRPFIRVE